MKGLPLWRRAAAGSIIAAGVMSASVPATEAADPNAADPVERGEYVFDAAGCAGCHTGEEPDAAPLAGGRALETPFGVFYSPNITPDPVHGIGAWSEADLARALREGRAPEGYAYFPAFPYTSYTGMTDRDVADLWAYLRTVAASSQANRAHELGVPYRWRFLLPVWRFLNFEAGAGQRPDDRGAYLAEVLGHCGECHTPRGILGGLQEDRAFAGTAEAPEGDGSIPNITPDEETGIGGWSESDLLTFLEIGMTPDGDFAGGSMAEVIESTTSRLTADDRAALVGYLRALPPIENAVD